LVDYVKELNDRIDDYNDSMLKHLGVLVNMDSGSNYKKSVDALVDVLESWWRGLVSQSSVFPLTRWAIVYL
jgi:hypothetical protein